jgi:hypothetical protein
MEPTIKDPLAYFKWCLDPITLDNFWEEFEQGFIGVYGRIDKREGNRLFFYDSPNLIEENSFSQFDDFEYFLELKFRPERKKLYNLISEYAIETITEESYHKFSNYIRINIVNKINQLINTNIKTIIKHSIMLVNFKLILNEIEGHYYQYLNKPLQIDTSQIEIVDIDNHIEVINKVFGWLKGLRKNGIEAVADYDCLVTNLDKFLNDKNYVPTGEVQFLIYKNNLIQYLFGILMFHYPFHCTIDEWTEFVSKFIINFKDKKKKNTFSKKYRTPPDTLNSMKIPDFIKDFSIG